MPKSTRNRRPRKSTIDRPPKPLPDFPLCPANNGYWQKKIKGKIHYFGHWGKIVNGKMERLPNDGWQEALALYKASADTGFTERAPGKEGLTVKDLCNQFLTSKKHLMDSGEISARTFKEYQGTTDRLIATFGRERHVDNLRPGDFEGLRADIARTWGPVRLGNEITRVKTVFKYGRKSDLIPPEFKKPSKNVMRKHRAANGKRLFEAAEIRDLANAASPQLKAMILLGVNAGFGNADCAALPQSALDLKGGWITFPRPKTGIDRRVPLWPETVAALAAAIADRPTPKDETDFDLVFVTKYGHRWVRTHGPKNTPIDSVLQEFTKLLNRPRCPACGALQANVKPAKCAACKWEPSADQPFQKVHRKGLTFYALRHTFRTIADAAKDLPAVRLVMGHTDGSIDDVYREFIDDSRLRAVVEHVRCWLFGVGKTPNE